MANLDFSEVASPVPLPRLRPEEPPLPRLRPAQADYAAGLDWSSVASPTPEKAASPAKAAPTGDKSLDFSQVASVTPSVMFSEAPGGGKVAQGTGDPEASSNVVSRLVAAGIGGANPDEPLAKDYWENATKALQNDNSPYGSPEYALRAAVFTAGGVLPTAWDAFGRAIGAGGSVLAQAGAELVQAADDTFGKPEYSRLGDPEAARSEIMNLVNYALIHAGMSPVGEAAGSARTISPEIQQFLKKADETKPAAPPPSPSGNYARAVRPALPPPGYVAPPAPEVRPNAPPAENAPPPPAPAPARPPVAAAPESAAKAPSPEREAEIDAEIAQEKADLAAFLRSKGMTEDEFNRFRNTASPAEKEQFFREKKDFLTAGKAPRVPETPQAPRPVIAVPPRGPEQVSATPPPPASAAPGIAHETPLKISGVSPLTPQAIAPPAQSPAPISGSSPPETPTATFKTAKGSAYVVHDDGTTTRNKSSHVDVGHDATDVGAKERSVKTIYLDRTGAGLSTAGLVGKVRSRVVIRDGLAGLITWNEKENRWGIPGGKENADSWGVPFHNEPAVGRYPLELWQPRNDQSGYGAYAGMHAGNQIVEMGARPASSPPVEAGVPTGETPLFKNAIKYRGKVYEGQTGDGEKDPHNAILQRIIAENPKAAADIDANVGDPNVIEFGQIRDGQFSGRPAPAPRVQAIVRAPAAEAISRKPIVAEAPKALAPPAVSETQAGIPETPPAAEPMSAFPPSNEAAKRDKPAPHWHATSGEAHPVAESAEIARVRNDPAVQRYFDRPIRIDRSYDVPYLAGYSKDGRTIYIDRHLPASLKIAKRKIDILHFIAIHERWEKAQIDVLKRAYQPAHQVATGIEHEALVARYGKEFPKLYEDALRPFIKHDQHERLTRVPQDLDLTPYNDTQARNIEARMKGAEASKPVAAEPPQKLPRPYSDWQAKIAELDARNAPDKAYRSILSTGAKEPLKKGETWRGRVRGYVDKAAGRPASMPEPVAAPTPAAEAKPAPTPKPGAGRRTQNLHQFLKANGGIKDSTDSLRSLYPDLINDKTGRPLDDARLIAAEEGYLGGNTTDAMANTTVDDLLTALRNGRKTFPQTADDTARRAETEALKKTTKGKENARHEIEAAFADGGIPHDADFLDRATRIYLAGGVTPESAIDRAIGEIEREEFTPAQVKRVRANLPPGWDDDLAHATEPPQSSEPAPQDGGGAGEPAQRRPVEEDRGSPPGRGAPAVEAGADNKPQTVLPGAEAVAPAKAKAALKGERAAAEAKVRAQQSKMRRGGQVPVDEQSGGLFEEKSGDLFAGKKDQTLLSSAERETKKPVFYSAALRAVENAKITKGTPEQWAATIRNTPGVKDEELQWLGLDDWLKSPDRQTWPAPAKTVEDWAAAPPPRPNERTILTKDKVAEFVRANQIEVKEVVHGGGAGPELEAEHDKLLSENSRLAARHDRAETGEERADIIDRMNANHDRMREIEAVDRPMPKHSGYQLPGGTDYRELLLTLPTRDTVTKHPVKSPPGWGDTEGGDVGIETRGDRGNDFRHSHWDEPNVVAHVRFNDRMAPLAGDASGRMVKTLHVEEGQSDWHKAGRKEGYATQPRYTVMSATGARVLKPGGRDVAVYDDKPEADAYAAQHEGWYVKEGPGKGVPDAPFKTTWPELILKRMIRYAAEHGYEQITWAPGIVQVDRYTSELRQRVKSIAWDTTAAGKEVFAIPAGAQAHVNFTLDERGVIVKSSAMGAKDHTIEEVVGKEIGRQIMEQPDGTVEGEGLTIGGKGFTDLYDKQFVQIANKLGKKFGAKVGETKINGVPTDKFDILNTGSRWQLVTRATGERVPNSPMFKSGADAEEWLSKNAAQPVHALAITPAMRASVMEGQPLFKRTPGTIPPVKVPPEARANLERALQNKVAHLIGAERAKAISFEPVIHAEGAGDPEYQAAMARYAKLGGKIGPTAGGSVRIMPSGEALIRLATDDPKFSPMGSARHEPMHVAQAFLMTDEEVAALSTPEAAKAIAGLASEELGAPGRGEKLPPYEALAIGYERYDRMRDEGMSPAEIVKGIGGGIRGMLIRVFERLRKLLADIRKALTGSRGAWGRWQDVFQDFSEGKMAGREARLPVRDLTRGGDMRLGNEAERDIPRSDYAELLSRAARGEETPPLTKAQARERKRAAKEFPMKQRMLLDKTTRQLAARAEEVAQMADKFVKALKQAKIKTDAAKFALHKKITKFQENVDHQENQPKLTPTEQKLYDEHYKPLFDLHNEIYHDLMQLKGHMDEETRAAFEEMANPEYVHHVVQGKGGKYDRIAREIGYGPILGRRKIGNGARALPVSASAAKASTFYALENDRTGQRVIVSRKPGEGLTQWKDGKPTAGKGKFPDVELKIGKSFKAKTGDTWTVQRAKLDEKVKHAPVDYYRNVYATTADSALALEHAKLGLQYFDQLTKTPEWKEMATRKVPQPEGWKQIDRAPLHGWYLHPDLYRPLIDYYGGEPILNLSGTWLEGLNRIATASIFISPIPHVWNVANHAFIERGWDWLSAPGYARLAITGAQATKSVMTRDARYIQMLRDGAPLFYSNSRNTNLIQHIFDRVGAEMETEKPGGFWHQVAKAFEYPSPAALVPWFYREVNRGMWAMGDIMMMQRILELEWKSGLRPALTQEAAIKRARQHIPDYVVPPKVAGSRILSRVLQDMMLTMFGRYRYSQYKTPFHDASETIGLRKSPEQRGAAIGRLLAMYVAYTALYPMLDEYLQKLLGIPDAKIVRGGPFHIVENAERLREAGAAGIPRFLFTTFIPSPVVTAIIQLFTNHEAWRDSFGYGSPPIIKPGDTLPQGAAHEGEAAASALGIASDIRRAANGQLGQVVGQQLGVKLPPAHTGGARSGRGARPSR